MREQSDFRFLHRSEGLTRWIVGCIGNGTATQAYLSPRYIQRIEHIHHEY